MGINTIILIDKNQKRKEYFMEKLKQKISFSYTKLEALFQTISEIADKKSYEFKTEKYLEFLDKFLNNLSDKQEMYLIDADELAIQNADKLIEGHNNIIIIYLQKEQDEGKAIQINGNEEVIDKLIEELVSRMIL